MVFEIPDAVKTWSQFGHPIFMWVLLGLTVYALYLGIQIRKTRAADKDTRKELIKKNFNQKHHQMGSILLALMILGSLGGMAVTYINNGKLFVGPHLLTGLGMTGIIAVSASGGTVRPSRGGKTKVRQDPGKLKTLTQERKRKLG